MVICGCHGIYQYLKFIETNLKCTFAQKYYFQNIIIYLRTVGLET